MIQSPDVRGAPNLHIDAMCSYHYTKALGLDFSSFCTCLICRSNSWPLFCNRTCLLLELAIGLILLILPFWGQADLISSFMLVWILKPLIGRGKVSYILTLYCACLCIWCLISWISMICRVLKALTRKFKLKEDVSLLSIAKRCPPNFTGADMYALCADAWFHAAKRKVCVFILYF